MDKIKEYKGYIVHPTYKVIGQKAVVELYGRLTTGESFVVKVDQKPYFFILKKDIKKAEKLAEENFITFEKQDTKIKSIEEEKLIKILLNIPKEVPLLRKIFTENKIKTFEADVRFEYRYLIDNNIKSAISIIGKPNKINNMLVFENPKIKPIEIDVNNIPLKIMSIDIETSMNGKELYCISCYCNQLNKNKNKEIKSEVKSKIKPLLKSFIVSKEKVFRDFCSIYDNEKTLLIAFKDFVKEYDPDLIIGWNLIDFDLKYINNKMKKYEIKRDLGRDDEEIKIRIEKDFIRESKAFFNGRIVLDGIHILKNNFIRLEDYKLNTAAKIIGEEKLITQTKGKGQIIDEMFRKDKESLIDYNMKDAELVYKILESKDLFKLSITRSLITGMPLDRIEASIATLDFLYLSELKKRGYAFSTKLYNERGDKEVKGGFVLEPKSGLYENVCVLDFKSLYPNIIRTFNIDPISLCKNQRNDCEIKAPNNVYFKRKEAILPYLISKIMKEREEAKKNKNEIKSYALKITMNSFYGALGNENSRYFNTDLGNAITSFARFIIQHTIKFIENKKYNVIYSDTDSTFIETKQEKIEDAEKTGYKLQEEINKYYEKFIKEHFKQKSYLFIEFEKLYKKIIFLKQRHEEKGAKKRYAGLTKDNKIDITGLEFVRRDWTELSKEFQYNLLKKVFNGEDYKKYIKEIVKELKQGKHDDKLVYIKALTKDIDEYTKTTPPHVKAAKIILNKKGKIDSRVIKYYMTTNGPEPVEFLKSKIDYEHYIEKQIKPLADSILILFNENFDDIIKGHKQRALFEF